MASLVSHWSQGHFQKNSTVFFAIAAFVPSLHCAALSHRLSHYRAVSVPEKREEHTLRYASALYGYSDRELFFIL